MRDEILELKKYYQEFHHKCIGWHITIMGLFIAGTIAAGPSAAESSDQIGWSIIVLSGLLSLLFFICLFHYSKRIEILGQYLKPNATIPEDWHEKSTKVGIAVHGVGSVFFLAIIIAMQGCVTWFSFIKYLL